MTTTDRQPQGATRLETAATMLLMAVVLLIGGLSLWDRVHPSLPQANARPSEPPPPLDPISIAGTQTRGNRDAKVALIEFSDFQCPYCARSARELLPHLERQYLRSGKALLAWRHFPLASHQYGSKAAEAATCAGRQGKFWDFHDWLFQNQRQLAQTDFTTVAAGLRLDMSTYSACLDGQATDEVLADLKLGSKLGVNATPTWFVGIALDDDLVEVTQRITGVNTLEAFQMALDRAIETAEERIKDGRQRR